MIFCIILVLEASVSNQRKIFVLDTNILLYDPESIFQFRGNDIVIPLTVIEELDDKKRLPNALGKNARTVIRHIDQFRKDEAGSLHDGVNIDHDISVRVLLEDELDDTLKLDLHIHDNKILSMAYHLHKTKDQKVVFVSKDLAARIKADALGMAAEDYERLKVSFKELYSGHSQLDISQKDLSSFLKDGHIPYNSKDLVTNTFMQLDGGEKGSAIGRFREEENQITRLRSYDDIWGIKPRNFEQQCALDLLLDDSINLVTLIGPAGTGKTLLALAAGLNQVFDRQVYRKILMSRPIVPLGRDIGYLPGTKDEKLSSWMQPIYDNLEFLCGASQDSESYETMNWVMESDRIEVEAVTYIRGRSLPGMFIIIDEAQNLTPHEIKTFISRAGERTKVVLAGDPTQIDNPYLDQDSNGLTYTAEKFRGQSTFGHIFLDKTERSQLAALAAALL